MKTERLIAIIMLLMESDKISASKLANMFEVTKRTVLVQKYFLCNLRLD